MINAPDPDWEGYECSRFASPTATVRTTAGTEFTITDGATAWTTFLDDKVLLSCDDPDDSTDDTPEQRQADAERRWQYFLDTRIAAICEGTWGTGSEEEMLKDGLCPFSCYATPPAVRAATSELGRDDRERSMPAPPEGTESLPSCAQPGDPRVGATTPEGVDVLTDEVGFSGTRVLAPASSAEGPTQVITISNAGEGVLRLRSVDIVLPDVLDNFEIPRLENECVPMEDPDEIAADAVLLGTGEGARRPSCSVTVRFHPRTPGDVEATLRLDIVDDTAEVRLFGSGIPGALEVEDATLPGAACIAVDGDLRRRRAFTVTNAGPGDVLIGCVAPAADDPPEGGWFDVDGFCPPGADPPCDSTMPLTSACPAGMSEGWLLAGASRDLRLSQCRARGAEDSSVVVTSNGEPISVSGTVTPATSVCLGGTSECP